MLNPHFDWKPCNFPLLMIKTKSVYRRRCLFLSDLCCTCNADLKGRSSFSVLSHSLLSFMFVLFQKKRKNSSRIFAPGKYFDMNSACVQNLDFIWLCCDGWEETKPAVDDCGGGTSPPSQGRLMDHSRTMITFRILRGKQVCFSFFLLSAAPGRVSRLLCSQRKHTIISAESSCCQIYRKWVTRMFMGVCVCAQ